MNSWKMIKRSLGPEWQDPAKQETLIEMFLEKVKNSDVLALDIREFERMELGDPKRTLRFLEAAAERILAGKQLDKNRQIQIARLQKGVGVDANAINNNNGPGAAGVEDEKKRRRRSRSSGGKDGKNGKGGKGGKKGPKGGPNNGKGKPKHEIPCMYYANGNCTYGNACGFKHAGITPNASRGNSVDPGKGGKKGKKGKKGKPSKSPKGPRTDPPPSKGPTKAALAAEVKTLQQRMSRPLWCAAFMKDGYPNDSGSCPHGAHLSPEVVQEIKAVKKRKASAAKQKAAAAAGKSPAPNGKKTGDDKGKKT